MKLVFFSSVFFIQVWWCPEEQSSILIISDPTVASTKVQCVVKGDENMTPMHMTMVVVWHVNWVQKRCPSKEGGPRLIQFESPRWTPKAIQVWAHLGVREQHAPKTLPRSHMVPKFDILHTYGKLRRKTFLWKESHLFIRLESIGIVETIWRLESIRVLHTVFWVVGLCIVLEPDRGRPWGSRSTLGAYILHQPPH